jgi:acetylornithine deacetylase
MIAMSSDTQMTSTEILSRLVSFDTTSRNSNLPLIGWMREYLDGLGVHYRLSHDASGERANLHVIIGTPGPGGIALSGHVDTVPIDGQAWSSDPFQLRAESGRLVGRGAADMKGFVACCLAAVPRFQSAKLRRPIHLFISYDEEVDCAGARRLIVDLAESGQSPALCIVGEPTSMQPILGHKGRIAVDVKVRGLAGHSSVPSRGVNAVHAAAEAVAWIAAEQRRFGVEGPFVPGFDPPYTTVHVGMLSGGTILNIIPELAKFRMEWRVVPGDDVQAALGRLRKHVATAIEPRMHAVDPSTGFTITVADWLPGLSLDPDHELASLVRQLTGSNSTGYVSYGTEAGLYQDAGIPSIVCGPGDIAQAHTPDEWILASELDACDAFLARLAIQQAA